jgi:hypothetical protein
MSKKPREKNLVSFEVQKVLDSSFNVFNEITDKGKKAKLSKFSVDYKQLEEEIQRLIDYTKSGKKFENFHSLFIFGPTGNAKCSVADTIVKIKIKEDLYNELSNGGQKE